MISSGQVAFQYIYQIAPVVLLGGIASQFPGGSMSVFSLLQASSQGAITDPGIATSLDDFPQFIPMSGATLVDNDIGEYPFANQNTAANAIITKPLVISYRLIIPANAAGGGYAGKQAMVTAFQQSLQQHNRLGGLYACATPAFFWDACILRAVRDVSPPVSFDEHQPQVEWELDFEQPLVTAQQAQQAANTLMSKIQSSTQLTPSADGSITTSGPQAAAGNPSSGQGQFASPPAQSPGLSSTGGFNTLQTGGGSTQIPSGAATPTDIGNIS